MNAGIISRYKREREKELDIKLKGSAMGWQYHWSGNGMLQKVTNPHGSEVTFNYDPLGRRIAKQFKGKVTRWLWDGNVPLHEWHYMGDYPPLNAVNEQGKLIQTEEPVENLVTWIYENGSFVPCAKITENEQYSIVADYLGTPTHAYSSTGEKVWERELDIYGAVRKESGIKGLVPQLYQGQMVDAETGLAYNRFRYFDSENGNYISKDPLRLGGGLQLYGYVKDSNRFVDMWGLTEGEIAVGDSGHHVPAVKKSEGRPFAVSRSDKTRPTVHFKSDNPAADHWTLHDAERTHVGPRQGSFKGTDTQLFEAYKTAYKDLDHIKVDVKSPNGKHLLGTNVTPLEAVNLVEKWLKENGLHH